MLGLTGQLLNASEIIYTVVVFFGKLAILLQMKRVLLTSEKGFVYWALQVLIIGNSAFYILGFFIKIFECAPRGKIFNPLLPGSCIDEEVSDLVAASFNFASDSLMLGLPIYAILRLGIALKQKVIICAIFATGLL